MITQFICRVSKDTAMTPYVYFPFTSALAGSADGDVGVKN
jgi:hypothetical protein